jgi:hypothetical protein
MLLMLMPLRWQMSMSVSATLSAWACVAGCSKQRAGWRS